MTRKQTTSETANRAEALTGLVADPPKADDHDGVRDYLHALAALGCAPLLVLPGTKQPADMRTPQRRTADDRAARQAARDAGRRNWQRVKSDAGVHLASADPAVLGGYVDRYGKNLGDAVEVNVALSLGRSRLVVVDCDTVGQLAAFLVDAEADPGTAPTVTTPGSVDPVTGEWLHSEGGHFWFVVPDGTQLPESPGALTDPDGGYAVMWGPGRYVLTPPSVRPEGAYVATGDAVSDLPGWLCERITEHAKVRAERAQRSRDRDRAADDSPVTAWGVTITWAEILAGTDWWPTGKPDSCGCETWTAPGAHASPKSATAHEPGCGQWIDSPDPPLHVWTDHDVEPFDAVIAETGSPTITRLRAVAAIEHDNQIGAAMSALDLHDDDLSFGDADGLDLADGDSDHDDDGAQPASPPRSSVVTDPTALAVAEAKAKVADGITAADALFTHTVVLKHIAACADARGSSRVAVLVQVLMRTALAVPACVVIPASLGGDHVGLSVLAAVTGETSGGKGRAEAVGRDAIVLFSYGRERRFAPMTPSTGEGLVSMFAETEKNSMTGRIVTRVHTPAVLLSFKDIETFGALASRSGNSLVGALLSLYMGDHLGGFTREGARRVMLPAHTVVAGLSAGMQPEKGSVLLSPAMRDSGMPQRFVWTPVRNGRRTQRSADPGPMTVELPDLGASTDPLSVESVFEPDQQVEADSLVQIDVARQVIADILAADEAKDLDVFGAVPDGQDQLLGHAMLTQTKVAFLLAVLHGETAVTTQWWELAGLVMAVSEATSNAVAVASGAAEVVAERQAGERIGHRFAASDQVRDDAKVRQLADRLAARVGDDWASVNGTAFITSSKHGLIPEAWRVLIDEGRIEARKHEYQPGKTTWQYRRARD